MALIQTWLELISARGVAGFIFDADLAILGISENYRDAPLSLLGTPWSKQLSESAARLLRGGPPESGYTVGVGGVFKVVRYSAHGLCCSEFELIPEDNCDFLRAVHDCYPGTTKAEAEAIWRLGSAAVGGGEVSTSRVQEILNCSASTARRRVHKLCEIGILVAEGAGSGWILSLGAGALMETWQESWEKTRKWRS